MTIALKRGKTEQATSVAFYDNANGTIDNKATTNLVKNDLMTLDEMDNYYAMASAFDATMAMDVELMDGTIAPVSELLKHGENVPAK
jgi:hypothetical protein